MHVWVICDDYWHPAETVVKGLEPLKECGFAFEVTTNANELFSGEKSFGDRLKEFPVILFAKSNNVSAEDRTQWVTDEVQQTLREYVENGGGLLAVHSGTASYKDMPAIRSLLGGIFTNHPPQCPVTVAPKEGHPITKGAKAFTLTDEHYFMVLDDPQADVFMTTGSEHGEQPGGWTRTQGKGRVCVLSPGHNLEVWLHPSFQTLLKNALNWCAGE